MNSKSGTDEYIFREREREGGREIALLQALEHQRQYTFVVNSE